MYVRRSSRVVLFDQTGAVLLVRSRFRRWIPGSEWAWFLPGGGVEPGETVRDAAVREVREETRIDIRGQSLTDVAYAEGHGRVGELVGPMRDDVFAAEAPSSAVVTDGMEPHDLQALGEFRWWRLLELRETTEPVFPLSLARVLERFVAAKDWPGPVRLPW